MKIKYSIVIVGYSTWCGLGFIRGVNSYKYYHNKYDQNEPYLYTSSVINGFLGIFVYFNPVFFPITIHKELYRLETNLRNLENEKKSKYYNELL